MSDRDISGVSMSVLVGGNSWLSNVPGLRFGSESRHKKFISQRAGLFGSNSADVKVGRDLTQVSADIECHDADQKKVSVGGERKVSELEETDEKKLDVISTEFLSNISGILNDYNQISEVYNSIKTRAIEANKSEKEAEIEAKEVVEEFQSIQAEVELELAAEDKEETELVEERQEPKSEQKDPVDLSDVEKLGVEQVLKNLGDPLKKNVEIAAYEEYIKHSLVEVGKDPNNDTLLRKTRIAIDKYFAKHPEQAKAFFIGLQVLAAGGAAIVSAPLIPAGASASIAMAVFAATYYMLDKAGELCSIGIEKAAETIAKWQAKEPAEQANLTADYNLLGTMMLFGFTKKRVGKNPNRPTWRQTEIDEVARHVGQKVKTQVSFIDGKRCTYGLKGSVRVDLLIDNVAAIEMKNYNLVTNVDGLVSDIVKQAIKHKEHLPQGVRQVFKVDARGQVCDGTLKNEITKKVVIKSDGLLTPNDVKFVE